MTVKHMQEIVMCVRYQTAKNIKLGTHQDPCNTTLS